MRGRASRSSAIPRATRLLEELAGEDTRGPFQRDRDRILYCAQFRRLSGVTQVTSPSELHSFHNRLTHTLEVAQIARRIAERFLAADSSLGTELDPDVCEAAALIHDLGHPPFGHNGEVTLDSLARGRDGGYKLEQPDEDGYEGNAQSLRIVTKLAVRSAVGEGLNLTAATLRASIKYPWLRGTTGKKQRKFGAFGTEAEILHRLYAGLAPESRPLEAQIMDWADDVAYSVHDLYDFALAGIIPLHQLKLASGKELRSLLPVSLEKVRDAAFESVVASLRLLPSPNLATASRFSSQLVGDLKNWVSTQITRFTSLELSVTGKPGLRQLVTLGSVEDEVAILKAITYRYAIGSPALAVRQKGERSILRALFEILVEDALGQQRLMSDEARARLEREQAPVRAVLDTISSMTDAQASSLYQKLSGISLASVLDVTTPSVL